MVLLNDVVEIFRLPQPDAQPAIGLKATGRPPLRQNQLIMYLGRGKPLLTDYAARRAQSLPISSAGDHVVGQRMKRGGHMRWTRRGARRLLQVSCAVPSGQDVRNFKRW